MMSEANNDSNLNHLPFSGSASSIAYQCLNKQNVEMMSGGRARAVGNKAVGGVQSAASYLTSDSLMLYYLTTGFGKSQNDACTGVVSQGTPSVGHRFEQAELSMNSGISDTTINSTYIPAIDDVPLFNLDPGAVVCNDRRQRFEPTQVQNHHPQLYTPGGTLLPNQRTTVSRADICSHTTRRPVHRVSVEEPLLKNISPHTYPSLNFQDSTSVASLPAVTGPSSSKREDTTPAAESTPTATKKTLKKRSKRKRPESWAPTNRSYRPYQEKKWTEQFQELLKFKAQHGHCRIPFATSKSHSSLSRWVKRQRYQYKLKQENKASALSDERMKELEEAGFVWDSHGTIWQERRAELEKYKQEHGDCNVPSCYSQNTRLSDWVKRQRRQYKKFIDGQTSSMTVDRFATLDRMGFSWKIRGVKGGGRSSPLDLL